MGTPCRLIGEGDPVAVQKSQPLCIIDGLQSAGELIVGFSTPSALLRFSGQNVSAYSSHLIGNKSEFILEPNTVTLAQKHRSEFLQITCSNVEVTS